MSSATDQDISDNFDHYISDEKIFEDKNLLSSKETGLLAAEIAFLSCSVPDLAQFKNTLRDCFSDSEYSDK